MSYSPTPIYSQASDQERSVFYNFRTETVVRLSGVFNRDFWVSGLPMAAQAHPAIWHASLAIGSMQIYRDSLQRVADMDPQSDMYEFALTHFNRAIATIVPMMQQQPRRGSFSHASQTANAHAQAQTARAQTQAAYAQAANIHAAHAYAAHAHAQAQAAHAQAQAAHACAAQATGDIDVVLLASVLFIAINNLLGDKDKASQHARSAMNLFQQWDFAEMSRRRGRDPTVIDAHALSVVYGQLSMQHGVDIPLRAPPAAPEHMPGLSSVTEAWTSLQYFAQPFIRYQQSRVPIVAALEPRAGLADTFDEMRRFDAHFYQWRRRFSDFRSSGIPSADDEPSIRALRLYTYTLSALLNYPLLSRSAPWRTSPAQPPVDDTKTFMVLMRDHMAHEMALTKGKGYIFMHSVSLADVMFQYGFIYKEPVLRNVFKAAMGTWPNDGIIVMAGSMAAVDTALAEKELHGHQTDPVDGGCICSPPETICYRHEVIRLDIVMKGDRAAALTVASVLEHEAGRRGTTTEAAW